MHTQDFTPSGFDWENCHDAARNVLSFFRTGKDGRTVLIVCNFSPVPRSNYVVGVDTDGVWREVLNSDSQAYGGSGMGNMGEARAEAIPVNNRAYSLNLTLPPLSVLFLQPEQA